MACWHTNAFMLTHIEAEKTTVTLLLRYTASVSTQVRQALAFTILKPR
jgi:hypothetical protein